MIRRIVFTAVVLLLLPSLLSAQTPAPVTLDFTGAIQSTASGIIVINGQLIDISAAQMNGLLLAPGVTVRIVAEVNPNGSLVARQLELVPVAVAPGLVELNGVVSDLTTTTLRLGSQSIDFTNAQLIGTLSDGQRVQIFARSTALNDWTALVIIVSTSPVSPVSTPEVEAPSATPEVQPPVHTPEVAAPVSTPEVSDDFRVEGRLEAVGSSAVIVEGQRYDIRSARIDDPLSVGAFVRMEVRVVDGQFVVERIRVEDDDD